MLAEPCSHREDDVRLLDPLDEIGRAGRAHFTGEVRVIVIESVERVRELEADFRARGVTIVHPFKLHRDGSASFYCADPDGVVIQILYEPTLSCQRIR